MPLPPNATPKQRFMESSDNVNKHRDMIGERSFERGIDLALLQYCAAVTAASLDPNTAMAAGWKIQGAHEFVLQLKMLAESPKQLDGPRIVGLNHDA